MKYSVVSIEEKTVRLESEDGRISEFSSDRFSSEIKEGDIVSINSSGDFCVEKLYTEQRRKTIHNKLEKLLKKSDKN